MKTNHIWNASDYYKFDRLYSYNGTFNFVVGGRGLGKTFGCKRDAIRSWIKRGEEFIYLRRNKKEVAAAGRTFMEDLRAAGEFPDWDFKVEKSRLVGSPVADREKGKEREWKVAGYFMALSVAGTQKSQSFPRVTRIIFDEFIIEKGAIHYIPNEYKVMLDFYSTIDRWKDKTRVFFLANAVSMDNPYFIALNIVPDQESEWVIRDEGFVVAHFPDSENFKNKVFETKFGKFIQGSDYAEFAAGNKFADNHELLLGKKDPLAEYLWTIETKKGSFSAWHNMFDNEWYVQTKPPRGNLDTLTLIAANMSDKKTYIKRGDKIVAPLRTAFRHGRVTFDTQATRNIMVSELLDS